MHSIRLLIPAAVLLLPSVASAQALIIQNLELSGSADLQIRSAPGGAYLTDQSVGDYYSGSGPAHSVPRWTSGDAAFGTNFATGRQDALGTNFASVFGAMTGNQPMSLFGTARYALTVTTLTPDTPLLLRFHTFPSGYTGSAYYTAGDMELGLVARISGGINTLPTTVWGVHDYSNLHSGAWTRTVATTDLQGIGTPTATASIGWATGGFRYDSIVRYDAFSGVLNFGLLQPGESFTVMYFVEAYATGSFTYHGSSVAASFTDPFGLGGEQPFVLEGVDYSMITIPEPSTYAACCGAIALGLAGWRRARRSGRAAMPPDFANAPRHVR